MLILDNCEHLLPDCARLVSALLKACSPLRILTTSRESLEITGEVVWPVIPLGFPAPEKKDRSKTAMPDKNTLADLMEYPAVRLFVDRAQSSRHNFAAALPNVQAVVRICRFLEGIPLAIELAAARARSLSVQEIETRLHDRFGLLTGGSRDAAQRQRTLTDLIDWSHNLLSESERVLLRRLSVFTGGWTAASAENVCSGGVFLEMDVLAGLTRLVEKSLVIVEDRQGQSRYRLLDTLRQYAGLRLAESGETFFTRTQHRNVMVMLAEEADRGLSGPDVAQWLNRLDLEYDNIRAALDFCVLDPDGGELGLQLAGSLLRFWEMRGYLTEGRERIAALLRHPSAQLPTRARSSGLSTAANLARRQGDHQAAIACLQENIEVLRQIEDEPAATAAINNLGILYGEIGDYARAQEFLEQALALNRSAGNRRAVAGSLLCLSALAQRQKDYLTAHPLLDEAKSICEEEGDRIRLLYTLNNMGIGSQVQGNLEEAQSLFKAGLLLCLELADQRMTAYLLENLSELIADRGEFARATLLWGAAQAIRARIGSPLPPEDQKASDLYVHRLQTALSSEDFAKAVTSGRELEWQDAIHLCTL